MLPGDVTQDGSVTLADLNKVLTNYNCTGMSWGQGDLTGDGVVDFADLNKVLTNYNLGLPSGSRPPERSRRAICWRQHLCRRPSARASALSATPAMTVDAPAISSSTGGAVQTLSAVDPRAVDRLDLGTVVDNELGHIAGVDDLDAVTDDIMNGMLGVGTRRIASHADAALASV